MALRFVKTPNPSQQYQHLTSAEPVLLFKSGLTDAVDVQAAVFREHVDREFVQPVLIFAEHFGDVVDGEDGCDGAQGQAA